MLRFDVAIVASKAEEQAAVKAHPRKFGWCLYKTRWKKSTMRGTVWAVLFYGLVEAV